MSADNDDVVSYILSQERNLQEIIVCLGDAEDWFNTSQEQIELGNASVVSESSIKNSIEHFFQAITCLDKALVLTEKVRNMDKLSREAEKEVLRSTELINRIKESKYKIENRKFLLESFDDALISNNWALVYQYAIEAQKIWTEKELFFNKVMKNASEYLEKDKKNPVVSIFNRVLQKKQK